MRNQNNSGRHFSLANSLFIIAERNASLLLEAGVTFDQLVCEIEFLAVMLKVRGLRYRQQAS